VAVHRGAQHPRERPWLTFAKRLPASERPLAQYTGHGCRRTACHIGACGQLPHEEGANVKDRNRRSSQVESLPQSMVAAIAASAVVAASPGLLAVNVLQGHRCRALGPRFCGQPSWRGSGGRYESFAFPYDVKPDNGSVDRWFQLTVDRLLRKSGNNVGLS
jgi:hypothetical protein